MIMVMGYHVKPLKILWRKSSDKEMQVASHTTARQGPAYLVMTVHTHALLTGNVKHSYIQPSHSSSCLCWRGPTSKGCDCCTIDFEKEVQCVVTTSKNLRKVGQTVAFKMLSSRQTNLITRHVPTAARCYQVALGKKEVARAHALSTHLHEGKEDGEIYTARR